MSDTTGGSEQPFGVGVGVVTRRVAAAPIIAAPRASEAIESELGAMADAMAHLPFTAETLAARLEEDPEAKRLAGLAALALALRGLSASDAATVNRLLAEGPRAKRREGNE